MTSRRTKWLSVLGGVLLIGGGLLMNYGTGVPAVGAQAAPPNPLTVIINKLDQVLTALGGIQEGNHTLRWDRSLPSTSRFVVLAEFNNRAVLDKNTGLVWEQLLDPTPRTWGEATEYCVKKTVGGTVGWRLPSVIELKSVQDPSLPDPFVPEGVFTNLSSSFEYWSASTSGANSALAWLVGFRFINSANGINKADSFFAWCVRGPMQESVY